MRSELFRTASANYYQVYTHHADLNIYDLPIIRKLGSAGFKPDEVPIVKEVVSTVQPFLNYANAQAYPTMEDIFEKDRIKSLDGIVLENLYCSSYSSEMMGQYSMIVDNIFSSGKKIPIYFVDVDTEWDHTDKILAAGGIGLGFAVAGVAIGSLALRNYLRKKKDEGATRRDFLRLMGRTAAASAGAALGMYMLGGHLAAPYHIGYSQGTSGKMAPYMVYLNTEAFPTKVINLRNAVWARKIDGFIAPHIKGMTDVKPTIAVVTGAMHAG
ncbi:MAG: hypothetical protein AABY09_01830, partial [Nanoarchaeota archaeon]